MKFSWISLNYFLNLDNIQINQLEELLTIKGFEIDKIDKNKYFNDYILDITITANRQDTLSVIGLAIEIGQILNQKISKKYQILQYNSTHYNNFLKKSELKYLSNIKLNKLINIKNNKSPLWLINYLQIYEIKTDNLINDIKEYIKIKWGHTIHFFNISNIDNINYNQINIQNNHLYENIQYNNNILIEFSHEATHINNNLVYKHYSPSIVACSYIYSNNYNTKAKNINNTIDDMKGYDEALKLISTFGKASISKSYSYMNHANQRQHKLKISKQLIQHTLGTTSKTNSKYLKQKTIYNILNQLNLKPKYNYYNKSFTVIIKKHRINDLSRPIDIIEEIGRTYGYQNFIDEIPCIHKKGLLSKQYKITKEIREYFRNIGIHEVINSSLDKAESNKLKDKNFSNIIDIYNPLLEDQSRLRNNLIDSLIQNKIYNYKQKNDNTELFEIGKVFIQNIKTNIKQEEIHLAGCLGNTNFIKKSWATKTSQLNWFHAKGTIEEFFEKLQIDITWHPINTVKTEELTNLSLKNFNIHSTICLRHVLNNKVVGIMGQLDPALYKEIPKNENIYIFEFNLQQLINNYNKKSHLSYIFSHYSRYPSVIRDISIKIPKNYPIPEIIKFIYKLNLELMHKVEVFNQYKDINNINKKCIGIRIIYNDKNRTLNQHDLQSIDKGVEMIVHYYESR